MPDAVGEDEELVDTIADVGELLDLSMDETARREQESERFQTGLQILLTVGRHM